MYLCFPSSLSCTHLRARQRDGVPSLQYFASLLGSSRVCTVNKGTSLCLVTSLRSAALDAYIWALGFLPTGQQACRYQTGLRAESVALLGSASDSYTKHLLPTGGLLAGWGFQDTECQNQLEHLRENQLSQHCPC